MRLQLYVSHSNPSPNDALEMPQNRLDFGGEWDLGVGHLADDTNHVFVFFRVDLVAVRFGSAFRFGLASLKGVFKSLKFDEAVIVWVALGSEKWRVKYLSAAPSKQISWSFSACHSISE